MDAHKAKAIALALRRATNEIQKATNEFAGMSMAKEFPGGTVGSGTYGMSVLDFQAQLAKIGGGITELTAAFESHFVANPGTVDFFNKGEDAPAEGEQPAEDTPPQPGDKADARPDEADGISSVLGDGEHIGSGDVFFFDPDSEPDAMGGILGNDPDDVRNL